MVKKIFQEPVVVFILIGLCFYGLSSWVISKKNTENTLIEVSLSQVNQLNIQFEQTWNRQATDEEMKGLIKEYIRDEIYYREAIAMGMDKNDPLIRRRMRQKLEIMMNDMTTANIPSDQILKTFMDENPEKFKKDPIVSFEQVYLNPDKHTSLDQSVKDALKKLKQGVDPVNVGDVTMLGYYFNKSTTADIARQFGEVFANEISKLPVGDWSGPYRSGMGLHIIKIHEHIDGRIPELSEIRSVVEREWMAMRSKELKDIAYNKLRANYQVVFEKQEAENE